MMPSKTPLHDQLAEHDERVKVANQRVQSLGQTIAEHAQTVDQLKTERIDAYSADDEETARRLKAKATKAEARAVELDERRMGAEVAARRAHKDRDAFVTENHKALVAERTPVARAAANRVEDAVSALSEAVAAWHAEAQAQAALLRTFGARTQGIPDLGIVHQLARDLQRAARDGVPAPVPDRAQVARQAEPEPEPDGDIRDGARAVLRARREAKADDDAGPNIEVMG